MAVLPSAAVNQLGRTVLCEICWEDLIMHEGQVPTVAFLKNNDGTMVQLGPFKEKLIIGCPNNFLGLMEGDSIRYLKV